jgi:hypothetical protein
MGKLRWVWLVRLLGTGKGDGKEMGQNRQLGGIFWAFGFGRKEGKDFRQKKCRPQLGISFKWTNGVGIGQSNFKLK